MTDTDRPLNARSALLRWISVDNISLLLGIALMSAGAAMWSVRAALLTSGALILGCTLLRVVLEERRR